MKDPSKRAPDVLSAVESLTVRGISIMRDFLIPLLVEDDMVLITPRKLLELYSKELVEIKGFNKEIKSLEDAYKVAKSVALGENIEIIFIGNYDWERGIP